MLTPCFSFSSATIIGSSMDGSWWNVVGILIVCTGFFVTPSLRWCSTLIHAAIGSPCTVQAVSIRV